MNISLRLQILSTFCGLMMFSSCSSDDNGTPTLTIPETYTSTNFDANVTTENTVIDELSSLTSDINSAESNAQSTTVSAINYPTTLSSVTQSTYKGYIDQWLVEIVNAANDDDVFQVPVNGVIADGEEGGLLGSRLLDEYGLELEQMVQKGSFGAALYNHAVDIIENGDLTDPATIDKLVEIHGLDISFSPSNTTAAATYSARRSDTIAQTGLFYDIKNNLLTAKTAIEAGRDFDTQRDEALANYLQNWEKSNFATVIFYCESSINQLLNAFDLPEGTERDSALGNALHAYAEGVAFASGFKGISNKQIDDNLIDSTLELLLAEEGQNPESYKFIDEDEFLNTLENNLETIISDIQTVYEFSDDEIQSFKTNYPTN